MLFGKHMHCVLPILAHIGVRTSSFKTIPLFTLLEKKAIYFLLPKYIPSNIILGSQIPTIFYSTFNILISFYFYRQTKIINKQLEEEKERK